MKEIENGWIKLNKKILKWGWYSDVNVKITFLHLLLVANYEEGEYLGQKIKRGQAVIGLKATSKKIGISIQNLRTALEKLEKSGEITRKSTNKFTLVTIENYSKYQDREAVSNNNANKRLTNDQQTTNKRPTNDQQHLRNKEYKNNKNIRNIYISDIVASEPAQLHDYLNDFVQMRKSIKAPLTTRALKSVLKELERLSGGDIKTKIAILEQSVVKCWKTVYPLSINNSQKSDDKGRQREFKEDPYSINF
mgnify:CR=1 FL=1